MLTRLRYLAIPPRHIRLHSLMARIALILHAAWDMVGINWAGRMVLGMEDNLGRMSSPWSIGEVLAKGVRARIRGCRHDSMDW